MDACEYTAFDRIRSHTLARMHASVSASTNGRAQMRDSSRTRFARDNRRVNVRARICLCV